MTMTMLSQRIKKAVAHDKENKQLAGSEQAASWSMNNESLPTDKGAR
jgi:hypothetical protein